MPRNVADHQTETIAGHGKVIKVIPAGGIRGKGKPADFDIVEGGGSLGEKVLLNFAGNAELLLVFTKFLLRSFSFGNVAQEYDIP